MPRPRKPRVDLNLSPPPEREELWEGVADALRSAIVAGGIPPGTSLVEADLAARFRVSRGPIRDALRELAREGIVVDLPRRGTIVSTLTFSDMRDVYAVREGLETVGARFAIERATDDALADLRKLVEAMESAWARRANYTESLGADLAFHRQVVALSASARLIPLFEQMLSQTQLLVHGAAAANPRMRLALRRSAHRRILDAIVARDVERTRLAIEEHYVYAEQRLFGGGRRRDFAKDPTQADS
jgi:DNA-binding GntR family transcriptional regulator